jgi:phosphate transport system permease protein
MSTSQKIDQNSGVLPRRPWVNKSQSLQENAKPVVAALLGATILVLLTGLAGPLGFYLAFVLSFVVASFVQGMRHDKVKGIDKMMTALVVAGFAMAFIPWASILFTVFQRGASAIYFGYFTHDMSYTAADDELGMGGLSHALVGSMLILLLASLIAIPFGIVTALYITEVKGKLSGLVRVIVQSMSGVPSIVAGLFIYSVIVANFSFSGLAGALALAILMLPTVARTSEEVLKLVPDDLRTSSYALGASQMATTFRIVLPTARSGLVTASMLGLARVAGETAPLILTAYYSAVYSLKITGQPLASLPMYIFQNFSTGTDTALTRAWGGAAVLLSFIFIIFIFARLAGKGARK